MAPIGEVRAPHVFSPVKCGDMMLSHRVAMGPMTRSRAPGEIANLWQAEHYAARTTPGGLLISEGTFCSVTARPYNALPGCLTEEHSKGWRKTTDAVHKKGGYIYAQLWWHVGMDSRPEFQPNGQAPVSASDGNTSGKGKPPSRGMSIPEIKYLVKEYRTSTKWAREAGFDGVEFHGAHGYLIDQFLNSSTNRRTDEYGGSIENRSRFLFEILDACLHELPASKLAIRLSPDFKNLGVKDTDPVKLFSYVLTRLQSYKLAYIQLTEPIWGGWRTSPIPHSQSPLKQYLHLIKAPTLVMLTGGYLTPELERAEEALASRRCQLIGIGRGFMNNPDLIDRLRHGRPLIPFEDFQKWSYGGDQFNYNDFPTFEEQENAGGVEKAKAEKYERLKREIPLDVVGEIAPPKL